MKLIINKLQKYGRNSVYVDFFKYSFVVIFVMFMIIMATFATVYCYNISYNQKHNLILENNKINAQLVSYFNIADNIYYQYVNEDVENFLNSDDYNIDYIRNSSKIQDMLRKIINISQHIDSIYLYTAKSDYVFSTINSNNISKLSILLIILMIWAGIISIKIRATQISRFIPIKEMSCYQNAMA